MACDRSAPPATETSEPAGADTVPRTPTNEPAATPALPAPGTKLTYEDRAAWRTLVQWPDDCEDAFVHTYGTEEAGLTLYEIDDRYALIEILCARGAYQGSQMYGYVNHTTSPMTTQLITFEHYLPADEATLEKTVTQELWGEATFLPQPKELTLLHFSRQTRDCGTWTRYAFDEGEARIAGVWARPTCPTQPEDPVDPGAGHPPAHWKKMEL